MLATYTPPKPYILTVSGITLLLLLFMADLSSAMDYSIRQASLYTHSTPIDKTTPVTLSIQRNEVKSLYRNANRDFDEKYYDRAIAKYLRAIELEPSFSPAYYNLGMAHLAIGQKKEAAVYLQTFLTLRPNAVNAHELEQLIHSLHQ